MQNRTGVWTNTNNINYSYDSMTSHDVGAPNYIIGYGIGTSRAKFIEVSLLG